MQNYESSLKLRGSVVRFDTLLTLGLFFYCMAYLSGLVYLPGFFWQELYFLLFIRRSATPWQTFHFLNDKSLSGAWKRVMMQRLNPCFHACLQNVLLHQKCLLVSHTVFRSGNMHTINLQNGLFSGKYETGLYLQCPLVLMGKLDLRGIISVGTLNL